MAIAGLETIGAHGARAAVGLPPVWDDEIRKIILYGLGRDNAVLGSEQLSAEGAEEIRRSARRRLEQFPKIEVWDASVCVFRGVRDEFNPARDP